MEIESGPTSKALETINVVTGKKKQAYVFGLFTSLVVIVLLVGAVAPSLKTISSLLTEIKEKESLLEELKTKLETLGSLQTQYDDMSDQIRDLELVFPNTGDFSLIMANFETVSETNGYNLRSITFGEVDELYEVDTNVLEPKAITIVVEGPNTNLIPLLKSIEAMPMYPVITAVSYTANESEDGTNTISIKMNIYEVNQNNFYE